MQGIVTKIQTKKRSNKSYGFITDGTHSYYFRLGDAKLKEGDVVLFRGEKNEKGNFAVNVRPVLDDTD